MNKVTLATAISLAICVAGCGGRHSPADSAPAGSTSPAASTTAGTTETPPANAAMTVKVVREDSDVGVAATIDRLDDQDKPHSFAEVNDSGVVVLTTRCNHGDRFDAKPKIPNYLQTEPQACATLITFKLYSAQTTYELIRMGDDAAKSGDLVSAQAHYGLAAARLKYANPEEAVHLKSLAAAAASRVLGVLGPAVTNEASGALSPGLEGRLREFQSHAGLPATGALDAPTRAAISKESPEAMLARARAAPSSMPTSDTAVVRSTITATQVQSARLSPATAARVREITHAEVPKP